MIGFCSQSNDDNLTSSTAPKRKDVKIPGIPETKKDPDAPPAQKDPRVADDIMEIFIQEDDDDDADEAKVHSFEIEYSKTEDLKHHLLSSNPVVEEYDFKNDKENPNLDLDLKPSTIIRPYQEKSLSKMFGDGLVGFHKFGWFFWYLFILQHDSRARSGIIVLPCGAGKTLVGITAACTIKKSILVLCTSALVSSLSLSKHSADFFFFFFFFLRLFSFRRVSVDQWKQQFLMWTTLQDTQVSKFTSADKENVGFLLLLFFSLLFSVVLICFPSFLLLSKVARSQTPFRSDHLHLHDGGILWQEVIRC